jgi:hypothetical protein
MSLDELSDEQSAIVLKTIDRFAKNRVISWNDRERLSTDTYMRNYLEGVFKDKKDVNDMFSIYEAKVKAYTRK